MISPDFTRRNCNISNIEKLFGHVNLHENKPLRSGFEPLIHNLCCEFDKIVLNLIDGQNTLRKGKIPRIFVPSESA